MIVDASGDIPSGRLVVDDLGPIPDETDTIIVPSGCYRVRACHTYRPRPRWELFTIASMGTRDESAFVIAMWQAAYAELVIRRAPASI